MSKSKIRNSKSEIAIGCQGWNYPDWTTKAGGETVFYPRGTRSNEMLEVYARAFETIEVDSTFYAIPAIAALENWFRRRRRISSFRLRCRRKLLTVTLCARAATAFWKSFASAF